MTDLRTTKEGIASSLDSSPDIRITQSKLQVSVPFTTTIRTTKESLAATLSVPPDLRVSQSKLQISIPFTTAIRTTKESLAASLSVPPDLNISQTVLQVSQSAGPDLLVSQTSLNISLDSSPPLLTTQTALNISLNPAPDLHITQAKLAVSETPIPLLSVTKLSLQVSTLNRIDLRITKEGISASLDSSPDLRITRTALQISYSSLVAEGAHLDIVQPSSLRLTTQGAAHLNILQPSSMELDSSVLARGNLSLLQPGNLSLTSGRIVIRGTLPVLQPSQLFLSPHAQSLIPGSLIIPSRSQFLLGGNVSGGGEEAQQKGRIYPYNRWGMKSLGTITSPNYYPAFPPQNTQVQQRSKVWRSTDLSDSRILRDFGAGYKLSSIVLVSTNSTPDGTFSVKVSNSPDMSSPVYSSGEQIIWVPFLPPDSDFSSFGGYPTNEIIDLMSFCTESARTVRILDFPEVTGRYVEIIFHDSGNPDGFFEVAWIYAGVSVELSEGIGYGFKWWPESVNNILKSEDGTLWIDVYYRQVNADAPITTYPMNRFMGLWQFLADYLGTSKEFVITFRADTVKEGFWFGVYSRFKSVPQFSHSTNEQWTERLEIEELP